MVTGLLCPGLLSPLFVALKLYLSCLGTTLATGCQSTEWIFAFGTLASTFRSHVDYRRQPGRRRAVCHVSVHFLRPVQSCAVRNGKIWFYCCKSMNGPPACCLKKGIKKMEPPKDSPQLNKQCMSPRQRGSVSKSASSTWP